MMTALWLVLALVAPGPRVVYLQPLQPAPPAAAMAAVQTSLRAFYPIEVRKLAMVPLPRKAWFEPRRRWRADVLVDWLAERLPRGGAKILGLTRADVSTSKGEVPDWGVLGLATLDGKACVISAFRARKGVDRKRARERLAKVAVHEVGHTFGLEHCESPGCLMRDAGGKVAPIDQETDLCSRCRAQLRSGGVEVPNGRRPAWVRSGQPAAGLRK